MGKVVKIIGEGVGLSGEKVMFYANVILRNQASSSVCMMDCAQARSIAAEAVTFSLMKK